MDNQQTQALKPKTDYTMDSSESQTRQVDEQGSTGGSDSIGDKLGSAVGGSTEGSGDSQSFLDKSINYLQQSITGKGGQAKETAPQGDTSHHAAVDEAHPEKISEFLRHQNRSNMKEKGK